MLKIYHCIAAVLLLVVALPMFLLAQSGTIVGQATDAETGEPLVGAKVFILGTSIGATTDADGVYTILTVLPGTYRLKIICTGYKSQIKEVQVSADKTITTYFDLEPEILSGTGIMVTANQALERETPVSFSHIREEEIQQRSTIQDVPHLFSSLPGIYVTSPGGSGLGDSEMRIRGLDIQRVQVMINNIPINDPESREVTWANWGSLSVASQNIQIQRGVSSSVYGSGAFGGSVNIQTTEAPLARTYSFNLTGGLYNTYKAGIQLNSGLLKGKYALSARFNYLTGNSWRKNTHYQGLQYYLGLTGFMTETHTVRVILHGTPQSRANSYSSTSVADYARYGRDFNAHPYVKDTDPNLTAQTNSGTGFWDILLGTVRSGAVVPAGGEVIGNGYVSFDNNVYHRPQLELHHSWTLGENTFLQSTAFISRGRGYDESINRYDLIPRQADGSMTMKDIIHSAKTNNQIYQFRAYAHNQQVGILSTLSTLWKEHTLSVGVEGRYWWARHFGTIINTFGQPTCNITIGNVIVPFRQGDVYYDYTSSKPQGAIFGHGLWRSGNLSLRTDAQVALRRYHVKETLPGSSNYPVANGTVRIVQNIPGGRNDGYVNSNTTWNLANITRDFILVSSKLGANYNLTDQLNVFTNYSLSQNEPMMKYLYGYGNPVSENLLSLETFHDVELGLGFKMERVDAKVTMYNISAKNKSLLIIDRTKTNAPGYDYQGCRYINAGEATYRGVEMEGGVKNIARGVDVKAGITLMQNRWGKNLTNEGLVELYGNVAKADMDFEDANGNGTFDYGEKTLTDLVAKYGRRYDVGMPQAILTGVVDYTHQSFFTSATARYHADYYILPNNDQVALEWDLANGVATKTGTRLEPWLVVDLVVGTKMKISGLNTTWSLHVNNLLNTQ
ncbi:MAG: TonB-dependent receptor, partial [candidate division KSB1 bacterium]|nr:TonB-dependent receptor [candidate division KSB1 bacterium]